jgi:TRAP-type C4-dicarboxylate transport system permease small subunit
MRVLDRVSDALAAFAGWVYVALGLMLTYEVVARYVFTAPTIWAEELSRLFFIYATLLAAPALLHHNHHIRVTALTVLMGEGARRAARLVSLGFVVAFCLLLFRHGLDAPINSFTRGRTSGSMLDIPAWWAQASVPLALALVAAQAAVEFFRTAMGAPLPAESSTEE